MSNHPYPQINKSTIQQLNNFPFVSSQFTAHSSLISLISLISLFFAKVQKKHVPLQKIVENASRS